MARTLGRLFFNYNYFFRNVNKMIPALLGKCHLFEKMWSTLVSSAITAALFKSCYKFHTVVLFSHMTSGWTVGLAITMSRD